MADQSEGREGRGGAPLVATYFVHANIRDALPKMNAILRQLNSEKKYLIALFLDAIRTSDEFLALQLVLTAVRKLYPNAVLLWTCGGTEDSAQILQDLIASAATPDPTVPPPMKVPYGGEVPDFPLELPPLGGLDVKTLAEGFREKPDQPPSE